jgi:hypothetical protein
MTMSTIRRLAPWLIVLVGAGAFPAQAQNIDAGKTPAQIFADTCTACHKSARELRRTGAGFLRSHYMTGSEEANAMASYLAGLPPDPRANPRRPPGAPAITGATPPADVPRQPPRVNPAEQAKGAPNQPASKAGRRQPTQTQVETPPVAAANIPEEKPSETAAVPAAPIALPAPPPPMPVASALPPAAAPKPRPVLEPFEE